MRIQYQNGTILEGLIVSLSGDVMRVAVKDADDVVEFRLVHGAWVTEDCEAVQFDFTASILAAVGIVPTAETITAEPPEVPCAATGADVVQPGYLN